ncbi:AAA-ATPase_like domain-containing protein [Nephila pilipes]|uniref:AAA-ATPase_like domain-containing protein n=1 Tax=Nephila pilipes TaxID=299642 RepID=A0A8X6U3S6_NEPPI|nr:AAA-ATPase_like domain-containing protein [Nephila pilipes]
MSKRKQDDADSAASNSQKPSSSTHEEQEIPSIATAESSIQTIQDDTVDIKEEPKTPPISATALPGLCASPIRNTSAIQIGTSSFTELVKKYSFNDKTMLIKDFIESGEKAALITCPRRFGKSINMDMMKTFLEIEVDENGIQKTLDTRKNYKLFTESNLQISIYKEFIQDHLGKYPVISLSFKDVNGANYDDILCGVKSIYKIYKVEDFQFKKGSVRRHYNCTFCDYSSPLSANVKRHLLTHTGERPFSCSVCGKGFIEKQSLTAHLLNHFGERPHKCNLCAKGFVRKSDLRAHMVVHLQKC